MYRYNVSGLIPRYCDACRTFITSRDSLTRNAHLIFHWPFLHTSPHPISCFLLQDTDSPGAARGYVMSFTLAERQAILFCSCPKNAGNLRQLACYCRQVGLLIAWPAGHHHYSLRFFLRERLSTRTVIFSSQSPLYLNVLYYLRPASPCSTAISVYPELRRGCTLGFS